MNNLIIKIYGGMFEIDPIIQEEEIHSLSIKEDISNFHTAEVVIPDTISGILPYQKVEIFQVENEDIKIFEGFISLPRPGLKDITLECKSSKALMLDKILIADLSFVDQDLKTIVEGILNQWNTAYGENWTTDIIAGGTTFSKDLKKKDIFFNIFDELASSQGFVWKIENNVLSMREILGEDKTTGDNFTEIVYDKDEPLENNLLDVKVGYFTTISNIVIGSDSTTDVIKTDPTSISTFGPLAKSYNVRDGNVESETQAYLDNKKNIQKIYTIDVEPLTIDPNIGDKIKLRIENVSEYMNVEGDVIVNTKETDFTNGEKIVKVGVSEIYVTEDSFIRKINNMKQTLDLLKIK